MSGASAGPGRLVIVGAGLTGPFLGILLARRGWQVDIVEARPDPRTTTRAGLRSINLTLSERGLRALRAVGLEEQVLTTLCIPLRARAVHRPDGAVNILPYGDNAQQVLHSVSRAGLTELLTAAAARHPRIRFHFDTRCVEVDRRTATVVGEDVASGARRRFPAEFVVGADGVHSTVRRYAQHAEFADLRLHHVPWRYKEITVKEGLDPTVLHVWPRGDRMMFALPNRDGSCNGVCVLPVSGVDGFDSLREPEQVRRYFDETFPEVSALVPDLEEQFLSHQVAAFPTMLTSHWYYRDTVVLVGDACHTVVPFYGQGMNSGLEDCLVLDRCLAEHTDRAAAFAGYQALRLPSNEALARLSLDNFTEMRESARQDLVAARRTVIHWLHRWLGERVVPLYTMVAHSTTPYADCVLRAERQERLLRWFGYDVAVVALAGVMWVRRRLSGPRQPRAAPRRRENRRLAALRPFSDRRSPHELP
ncbi:NAD(P)/FAD-dependent oxidoreductase [Micromonospora sp. NPDC005220]|uniref:FAD-dependent oxidoreductase n=1 Tax=Micromonospora sp. NPDC005220 TaxID=3155589 RepID=UPI0033A2D856